jgi:hypothetical protein
VGTDGREREGTGFEGKDCYLKSIQKKFKENLQIHHLRDLEQVCSLII